MTRPNTPPPSPARPMLPPPPPPAPKASFVSNAIGIGGFVVLAIIVVWGLTHLFNLSNPWFDSFFGPKNTITVSAPANVTTKEPFDFSWKYTSATKGNYSVLYQCSEAKLAIKVSDIQVPIPCGMAYTVAPSDNKLVLLPEIAGTSTSVKLPISVIFMPSATGTKAEGKATITINKVSGDTATTNTTSSPEGLTRSPATQNGNAPANNGASTSTEPANFVSHTQGGPADLSVRIVAVGVIDSNGTFVERTPTPSDMTAIEFDIANVGGTATGPWYFSADLPTRSNSDYSSPEQVSLVPGAHILNTLRFNELIPGSVFTVTADPQGQVQEATKENNTAAIPVGVGY